MPKNQSNATKFGIWSIHQNHVFPLVRLRSLSNLSDLFSSNFTRMIFVRHPLERLASAYVDKLTHPQVNSFTTYENLRRAICHRFAPFYLTATEKGSHLHHYRSFKEIRARCQSVVPKFEHFITYLMSDSLREDVHWQPYSTLCDVDRMKYNFIGKFETMNDDLHRLQRVFEMKSIDWNTHNDFTTGSTRTTYRSMYSQLPAKLICTLKKFYKDDLKLFDYRFEDYLHENQTKQCP